LCLPLFPAGNCAHNSVFNFAKFTKLPLSRLDLNNWLFLIFDYCCRLSVKMQLQNNITNEIHAGSSLPGVINNILITEN
jgi:hypothetical protein